MEATERMAIAEASRAEADPSMQTPTGLTADAFREIILSI